MLVVGLTMFLLTALWAFSLDPELTEQFVVASPMDCVPSVVDARIQRRCRRCVGAVCGCCLLIFPEVGDERPLRSTGLLCSGLGRAGRPCPSPVRQSLAGTERRGCRVDRHRPRTPTSKPRPPGTVDQCAHPQGCPTPVYRRQWVRRGSEQPIAGHPSLVGSRGGGGNRDSLCPERSAPSVRPPFIPYFTSTAVVANRTDSLDYLPIL